MKDQSKQQINETSYMANLSTTIQNSTTFQTSDTIIIQPPPFQKIAESVDKGKTYHKKLQNKLDKMIKRKDYELMLELTKMKVASTILPTIFKTPNQILSDDQGKRNSSKVEFNLDHSDTRNLQQIEQLSSIEEDNKMGDSPETNTQNDYQSDNSDDKELQGLIAEGEGKLKKKKYEVSYKTGTKSIMCRRFIKLGQCPNGDKCEYAHSKKELQFNSPLEWVQLIKHISNQRQDSTLFSIQDQMKNHRYIGENVGPTGQKTLMEACQIDDYKGVEQLLLNGANPLVQDFKGYDALYYSVLHNSLNSIKKIFEICGDQIQSNRVYGKKKRNLLTITAIYSYDIRILQYLLNNGIVKFNPSQTDRFQRNAIFYSLFRNKVQEVKLFIDAQASLDIPDLRGLYLLDYAMQFNYEQILLELVKGGARLGYKNKKGVELLMHAAGTGNLDLMKALLSKNVNLNSLSEETGENCLMAALASGKQDLIRSISEYVLNIEAFNQQNRDYGQTLLMKAILTGDIEIVKLLCNKPGIKFGIKDKSSKTELIHAVEKNNYDITKILLDTAYKNKMDLEINHYDNRSRTAIIYATINQNCKIMEMLLKFKFLQANERHVIKWKDELGKDVCDYAQTDKMKLLIGKYIEENNMIYQNYQNMMKSVSSKYLDSSRKKIISEQNDNTQDQQINEQKRQALNGQKLIQLQTMVKQHENSDKNKLKKIEEEINQIAATMEGDGQMYDSEKILILQKISKERLKQLQTIAVKFPKLNNLEQNPKFKQAIKQLYEESDLSKFRIDKKRKSVHDILQLHSPDKILKKHYMYRNASMQGLDTESQQSKTFEFPPLQKIISNQGDAKTSTINVKETLAGILSDEQRLQFRTLGQHLNKNLELQANYGKRQTTANLDGEETNMSSPNKKQIVLSSEGSLMFRSGSLPAILPNHNKQKYANLYMVKPKLCSNQSEIESDMEHEVEELIQLDKESDLQQQIKKRIEGNFS